MYPEPKNRYRPPASYTLRDLKKALNRNGKRPVSTKHMTQAAMIDWMKLHLTAAERQAVIKKAWDWCISRKKKQATKTSPS